MRELIESLVLADIRVRAKLVVEDEDTMLGRLPEEFSTKMLERYLAKHLYKIIQVLYNFDRINYNLWR